jgi:hypothetical protein
MKEAVQLACRLPGGLDARSYACTVMAGRSANDCKGMIVRQIRLLEAKHVDVGGAWQSP